MIAYSTLPDDQLIQLLKESDHVAYTEIYRRYFHLMYVHAYKKLRDEEQAKDIVQELFANLWFKREFDLKTGNLSGYLYTAIRNRIFDLFAHQQVATKYLESLADFANTYHHAPTDHRIRENQLKAQIEKEIQALPPKMKAILEMSRKEHLTHQQIAERLDTNTNNVSKQLNTALKVLKTKLGVILFFFL